MEIFINDKNVDFQLENEKFLKEVVAGVLEWASENYVKIQEIMFDGKSYSANEECENTLIEKVSNLNVSVRSMIDIHEENLQILYQYTSLFLKSVEGKNHKLTSDLKKDAAPIIKLLGEFLGENPDNTDTVSFKIKNNIANFEPENPEKNGELTTELLQQLTGLKIVIKERISELADPVGELRKATSALQMSLNEINDISVLLQSGKDREALGRIIRFSELSQKMLRLYPILKNSGLIDTDKLFINEMTLAEYYNDLNGILSELLEAFTANDSVLIGDLLEYEVAPRLENLTSVLENLQEENLK